MAVMIPDDFSPDIKSNAEKNIFRWFKESEGTEDWVVLHSLGIAEHKRMIHGEIDFLVLAPGLGMFALEVKGGRVQRKLGKWCFINRNGEYNERIRGPFDQAWEGIYSVKTSIENKLDYDHEYLKNMVFGIGVMFPDIHYEAVGIDEAPWQVFDMDDDSDVISFIEKISKGTVEKLKSFGYSPDKIIYPSKEDINYLSDILRGDFDREVPLKIKQKYAEKELLELTAEQALCIEQLKDNPRLLIRGTAGTGKTVLGIEAARQYASAGNRVAFICFNRLLGTWLEALFSEFPPAQRPAYVGTFHRFMEAQLIGSQNSDEPLSDRKDDYYFEYILPDAVASLPEDRFLKYDCIILDEAQDLITEQYLNVIDHLLVNGLRHGRWIMFGDFSRQSIYMKDMTEDKYLERIQTRSFFAYFRLTRNCRNTKKICIAIENLVGISENAAFEDAVDTPFVDYRTYSDMEDQKNQLINLIKELMDKNIQPDDIVILSPYRFSESVVNRLDGLNVREYKVRGTGYIRFSTIQAFKGLESSTVIITDIENYHDDKLIYVGMSRARFDLHIFETEKASEERAELFMNELRELK